MANKFLKHSNWEPNDEHYLWVESKVHLCMRLSVPTMEPRALDKLSEYLLPSDIPDLQ